MSPEVDARLAKLFSMRVLSHVIAFALVCSSGCRWMTSDEEPSAGSHISPTEASYQQRPVAAEWKTIQQLNHAFDFYNQRLFANQLPKCVIRIDHCRCHDSFGHARWDADPSLDGHRFYQIVMNAAYFSERVLPHTLSTLVHQSCHLYQFKYGETDYEVIHDAGFSEKMREIGLQTSSTGKPGGSKTGAQMTEYIIPGGPFERATEELLAAGFELTWSIESE